jgi:hypothetical protein
MEIYVISHSDVSKQVGGATVQELWCLTVFDSSPVNVGTTVDEMALRYGFYQVMYFGFLLSWSIIRLSPTRYLSN